MVLRDKMKSGDMMLDMAWGIDLVFGIVGKMVLWSVMIVFGMYV